MQQRRELIQNLLKDVPSWEAHPQRLALIAGDGTLPFRVIEEAQAAGFEVLVLALGGWQAQQQFRQKTPYVEPLKLGKIWHLVKCFKRYNISKLVFAGKVNKWLLFTRLGLDNLGLRLIQHLPRGNDDAFMRYIIELFECLGIEILPQTRFMQGLFQGEGLLTPTLSLQEKDWQDACFGFDLAREMGRLDVGQTVVVHNTMAIAIEAIEGTDECLKRGGKLLRKKGGTVAKVAKPAQDNRFDVPAVGLKTLKRMQQFGMNLLVTEAQATLFLDDLGEMRRYAEAQGIRMLSVSEEGLSPYRIQLAQQQYAPPEAPFHLQSEAGHSHG